MAKAVPASRPDGRPYPSLKRRRDFARVYRTGSRHRAGSVVVVAATSPEPGVRVGIVAGRRLGGAVERNRAKRRLRAAIAGVALPGGHDYIVIAGRGVNDAPFGRLTGWLAKAVDAGRRASERDAGDPGKSREGATE